MNYFLSTNLPPQDPERIEAEKVFEIATPTSLGVVLLRYPGQDLLTVPVSPSQPRIPTAEDVFRYTRRERLQDPIAHSDSILHYLENGNYRTFYIVRRSIVAWVDCKDGIKRTSSTHSMEDVFPIKETIYAFNRFIDKNHYDFSFWSVTFQEDEFLPLVSLGCTMQIDPLVQKSFYETLHVKLHSSCCRSVF